MAMAGHRKAEPSLSNAASVHHVQPRNDFHPPQLLADLSASLIGSYRVRVPAAPGSLAVQVWNERGCGSLQLD